MPLEAHKTLAADFDKGFPKLLKNRRLLQEGDDPASPGLHRGLEDVARHGLSTIAGPSPRLEDGVSASACQLHAMHNSLTLKPKP